ncbi:amidohydrolase [Pseudomonas sp. PDNC002]|uniref:amidohydrolase family protein n=1 Tax=Pseudomonas sp. PDNC002 TaxID=2811422 RepID=UPI0019633593|nr:amidohydrolase family protein [Pseudomonas sp. PDNC002]QRY77255.1 amidohydrolase [Pseudomonas sp. PDNC002]
MKRREFVIGAGVLASASLLAGELPALPPAGDPSDAAAPGSQESPPRPGRIDVHHHILPPFYAEALRRQGLDRAAGVPLPEWSAQRSLELLDAQGLQTAITSVSSPGVWFGNERAAAELARRCNEFAAELGQRHAGRFGSFACVPLPATGAACAEAIHALDVLKADGVVLLASNDGVFLGDPRFDELMAELDRRGATVFLHPNLHPSSQALGLTAPGFLLEFVCDTTRAAVNLILSGTLERYPRIRWILAHAGGFLPYAAWRVSLANALPQFQEQAPMGVMNYLQRFYFDTALAPAAPSMAVLRELVGPSQVLFGSDFPFAPQPLVVEQMDTLAGGDVWSAPELVGIGRGHALSLFPRFAQAGETVAAAPSNEPESTLHWMGRSAGKPLAALAQHLKD